MDGLSLKSDSHYARILDSEFCLLDSAFPFPSLGVLQHLMPTRRVPIQASQLAKRTIVAKLLNPPRKKNP
jgi:hypothetical protein